MSHLIQWASMGSYSLFVWSAYGLVALTLMMTFLGIKIQKRKTWLILQRWFKS